MNTEIKINSALQTEHSLLSFTEFLHEELEANNRHVTANLIQRYDCYLIDKGLTLNTVSTYLRNLRSVFNKAIKRGLICKPQDNPFANVHTGIYETKKRAMTVEEVQKLSELQFIEKKPLSTALHHSLHTFLFCIHARGMSYKDVLFLKKTDINTDNNHIEYIRSKTKKDMNAYITPPMREIIDNFSTVTPEDSPYIFPFIDPNKGDEYKQYQT